MKTYLTKDKAITEFMSLLNDDKDFKDLYCDTNSSFEQWLNDYEIELTD